MIVRPAGLVSRSSQSITVSKQPRSLEMFKLEGDFKEI